MLKTQSQKPVYSFSLSPCVFSRPKLLIFSPIYNDQNI